MDDRPLSILHYLPVSPRDEQWGIVCTTAGHQHIPPGTPYPVSEHPEHYLFYKGSGRTLDEYQLVYITAGRGRFESASCPSQTVEAGTMLLLFPNEWHSYSPDPGTGWTEWWVGFRGANIDRLEQQGFLCRRRPLLRIGCSGGIERCYREIIGTVEEERVGFQPLISSIVLHILGSSRRSTARKPSCAQTSAATARPNRSPAKWAWATRGSAASSANTWGWRRRNTSTRCGSTRPGNCSRRQPTASRK